MANPLIPAPEGGEPKKTGKDQGPGGGRNDAGGRRSWQGQRKKRSIPSVEDCLQAMAQLAGAVALGLLKPPQANAMRAAYREILQHHKSEAKHAEARLSNADVMEVFRKDPQQLSLLEPFLTSDQVAMVMKATEGGTDE